MLVAEHARHWGTLTTVEVLGVKNEQDFVIEDQGICVKRLIMRLPPTKAVTISRR